MPQEEEEEEVRVLTLPLQAHHAMEKMEEFVYKVQLRLLSWGRGGGGGGQRASWAPSGRWVEELLLPWIYFCLG